MFPLIFLGSALSFHLHAVRYLASEVANGAASAVTSPFVLAEAGGFAGGVSWPEYGSSLQLEVSVRDTTASEVVFDAHDTAAAANFGLMLSQPRGALALHEMVPRGGGGHAARRQGDVALRVGGVSAMYSTPETIV